VSPSGGHLYHIYRVHSAHPGFDKQVKKSVHPCFKEIVYPRHSIGQLAIPPMNSLKTRCNLDGYRHIQNTVFRSPKQCSTIIDELYRSDVWPGDGPLRLP
jgi:hypothetical protein